MCVGWVWIIGHKLCVCVCVYVCVCECILSLRERETMCVCVCVCLGDRVCGCGRVYVRGARGWMIGCMCVCKHVCASVSDFEFVLKEMVCGCVRERKKFL